MATNTETGHAKNNARFKDLIDIAEGMGAAYSPVKPNIQLKRLRSQYEEMKETLAAHKSAEEAYNKKTNERADVFEALSPFLARILSNIKLADASEGTLDDAAGFIAKLRGARRGPKPASPATDDAGTNDQIPADTRSVSQRSYDMLVSHFYSLVLLATRLPDYASNDPELSVEGLNERYNALYQKNQEVATAERLLAECRITRNRGLYADKTGILDTANDIKNYLRTLADGTANPHYKAAAKFQFSRPANL